MASGHPHVPATLHSGMNPGTNWKVGWVGPRGGLGSFEEEANFLPPPEFEPRILQPVMKSQRRSGSYNIAVCIELWEVCVQT